MDDLIRLNDVYIALDEWFSDKYVDVGLYTLIDNIPTVNPQEEKQLTKIADVVEGTIEHIDYDEAMDMLYDIKDILKDYERR